MPTPLRIAYPGAVYHLIDRGNDRADVFFDDDDRLYYLDLLASAVAGFRLKVYAYALMSNHIHLFLRTMLPNVSEVMYHVNIGYSHYFNKRHRKTGHLFESRFKSKLVQEDRYFLGLLRYVHMNPVKAGMVAGPGQYAWCSHRAYLGNTDRVVSDPNEALLLFSDNLAHARAAYLDFLGQPIPDKEWEILNKERNGILGDAVFRRSLKKGAVFCN